MTQLEWHSVECTPPPRPLMLQTVTIKHIASRVVYPNAGLGKTYYPPMWSIFSGLT